MRAQEDSRSDDFHCRDSDTGKLPSDRADLIKACHGPSGYAGNVQAVVDRLNASSLVMEKEGSLTLCKLLPSSDGLCLVGSTNGKIKWIQPSGAASIDQRQSLRKTQGYRSIFISERCFNALQHVCPRLIQLDVIDLHLDACKKRTSPFYSPLE